MLLGWPINLDKSQGFGHSSPRGELCFVVAETQAEQDSDTVPAALSVLAWSTSHCAPRMETHPISVQTMGLVKLNIHQHPRIWASWTTSPFGRLRISLKPLVIPMALRGRRLFWLSWEFGCRLADHGGEGTNEMWAPARFNNHLVTVYLECFPFVRLVYMEHANESWLTSNFYHNFHNDLQYLSGWWFGPFFIFPLILGC